MKKYLLAALASVLLASCAHAAKYSLQSGSRTPAAVGQVDVQTTKSDNEKITLKVQHLPRPADLQPGMSTFVAWMEPSQPEGAAAIPIGQLQIDKNREAKITTLTPYKSFDLFVTAENTATPRAPSDVVVLKGSVNARTRID